MLSYYSQFVFKKKELLLLANIGLKIHTQMGFCLIEEKTCYFITCLCLVMYLEIMHTRGNKNVRTFTKSWKQLDIKTLKSLSVHVELMHTDLFISESQCTQPVCFHERLPIKLSEQLIQGPRSHIHCASLWSFNYIDM